VQQPESPWIRIEEHKGLEAARSLIHSRVEGRVEPVKGHVVLL
jgi:hypothetical protein